MKRSNGRRYVFEAKRREEVQWRSRGGGGSGVKQRVRVEVE